MAEKLNDYLVSMGIQSKYLHSDIDTVVGIQFGLFSPEEIERKSVAEIYTHETYDGDTPKIGGLFDPRMGVLENGILFTLSNIK